MPCRSGPEYFESWARQNNMKPVYRDQLNMDGDILLADSEIPFWGQTEDGISVQFYRTGFCIFRDQCWIGSTQDYMDGEFEGMTKRAARDFRIAEALQYARIYLAQTAESGLYDGDKTSFSKYQN